jgi:hypothetical protein
LFLAAGLATAGPIGLAAADAGQAPLTSAAAPAAAEDSDVLTVTAHSASGIVSQDLPDIVCIIHVYPPVLSNPPRYVFASVDVFCDHPVAALRLNQYLTANGTVVDHKVDPESDRPLYAGTSTTGGLCTAGVTYESTGSAVITWPAGYGGNPTDTIHDHKTLTTTLATCPVQTYVPDLSGMAASQAHDAVVAAGLTPRQGSTTDTTCERLGTVASQSPGAGQLVDINSTVNYRIYIKPTKCPIIN